MRKLLAFTLTMALVAALSAYLVWTQERPVGHYLSDLRISLAVDEGTPSDRGNLLGIQPELFPADYQSLERLHLKLAAYLQRPGTRACSTTRPSWCCRSMSGPG